MKVKKSKKSSPIVIGWREWIGFPNLKIPELKVKIDTGAKTSCLHATNIEIKTKGKLEIVHFRIHPYQHQSIPYFDCKCELYDLRKIKSSSGHLSLRPVIKSGFMIAGEIYECEITLIDRDVMGFRGLLGRQALKRRFLVNPSKSFILSEKRD